MALRYTMKCSKCARTMSIFRAYDVQLCNRHAESHNGRCVVCGAARGGPSIAVCTDCMSQCFLCQCEPAGKEARVCTDCMWDLGVEPFSGADQPM